MAKPRDTYKYHFIEDGKIAHRGITNDLERREGEHQHKFGGGWIKQSGNRTTEDGARQWEEEGGKRSS